MGFITEGTTLLWEDSLPYLDYVKQHGILQLLHIFNTAKNRENDILKWGDEIEYIVVHLDAQGHRAQVALDAHDVLLELMKEEKINPNVDVLWRPEYGRYMIEATPGQPYIGIQDIYKVKSNMHLRRQKLESLLGKDEVAVTLTNFPLLGCDNCTFPSAPVGGPISESVFLPDAVINPHYRFSTLTANIRMRRGSKVEINVPLFLDKNTKPIAIAEQTPGDSLGNGSDSHDTENGFKSHNIYMDAMGFGMGACCLQCTFQCCNISEARHLYDQLAIMSGPMLALTAATPIFRGYLTDTDVRWNIIAQSVDDRTPEERGQLKSKSKFIPKSRYDSISTFISNHPSFLPKFNDINIPVDQQSYNKLIESGMDPLLAHHFAHLFIRDPLVIYSDKIHIDDTQQNDHFENIQSTNWQTVRFKPPPPNSSMGWRVEFRPMEVQITDFENAAFATFIVLLTRIITTFKLNLYMPISLVDENMKIAHKRDAVINDKFYFRKNITDIGNNEPEIVKMSISEIINGNGKDFPGLTSLIKLYLDTTNIEDATREIVDQYLTFISKRASGDLLTTANWIRKFVQTHPEYKHDSIVSNSITYDLITLSRKISSGEIQVPELIANFF